MNQKTAQDMICDFFQIASSSQTLEDWEIDAALTRARAVATPDEMARIESILRHCRKR